MKVLVLPSWYPPDGGSFFKEQSEAVAHKGIQTDVLSLRIKGIRDLSSNFSLLNKKIKKSHENGLNVYRAIYFKFPFTEKYNIGPWAKKIIKLFGHYQKKEGKPDLLHAHSSLWAGYAASVISEKYNIPYVLTEHRSRFVENNLLAKKRIKSFHYKVVARALGRAEKVIIVSNKLESVLTSIEPSIKKRIVTIPNFIDTSVFTPPEVSPSSEPFVFFSLGNLIHTKGMDVLIDAFKILKNQINKPLLLKIGGSGKLLSELKNQAIELGFEKDIVFTGNLSREQVIREMQNSHAFLLASRYEAFGVVFIEAMACGLPIIATKSGGPESIANNTNGYLVELEDPYELAEAMKSMVNKYKLFDRTLIRKWVENNYSQESTVPKIINIYKEAINEHNSAK